MIRVVAGLIALTAMLATASCSDTVIARQDYDRLNALASDAEALRRTLSDVTIRSFDPLVGTQYEYHSADGRTWLALRGRTVPTLGRWVVRPRGNVNDICYTYGGSSPSCDLGYYVLVKPEIVDGDPLGLSSGAPLAAPLPTGAEATIASAASVLGRSPDIQPRVQYSRVPRGSN